MEYYIDPQYGSEENSGTSPQEPLRDIHGRHFQPGDTVLFRRGTVIHTELQLDSGSPEGMITYGAYGEGALPVVNPSLDASRPELWVEETPGFWRFTDPIPSEVCNIVFDDGRAFGNLRWGLQEMHHPGEWYYDRLGESICSEQGGSGQLWLMCSNNPALVYRSVELVLWGCRQAVTAQRYVLIQDLAFEKCGVHGFSAIHASHITIRNCRFRCIGGAVFDREKHIRFGNGVEFWNGASFCTVEHCLFEDIYDSGVTHQGNQESLLAEWLIFSYNVFRRCGLAAYEWRGPVSSNVVFSHNRCEEAGGAFTMQGESAPRCTEKLEDISACVFVLIWLKGRELPDDAAYCIIRDNEFVGDADCEAVLLSTLDGESFRRIRLDHNRYILPAGQTLARVSGMDFPAESFKRYQRETGKDQHSQLTVVRSEKKAVSLVFSSPTVRQMLVQEDTNGIK